MLAAAELSLSRIHQVVIVPGVGWQGKAGGFNRGNAIPPFAEYDAIARVMPTLVDELEKDGIRFKVLPTHVHPGLSDEERIAAIEPLSLVVSLRLGWFTRITQREIDANLAQVFYGDGPSRQLADEVSDMLTEWGSCRVYSHRTGNPRQDPKDALLNVPECRGLRIQPFALNGPHAVEYGRFLPQLGTDLGRSLADYLRQRGLAIAIRRAGMMDCT